MQRLRHSDRFGALGLGIVIGIAIEIGIGIDCDFDPDSDFDLGRSRPLPSRHTSQASGQSHHAIALTTCQIGARKLPWLPADAIILLCSVFCVLCSEFLAGKAWL